MGHYAQLCGKPHNCGRLASFRLIVVLHEEQLARGGTVHRNPDSPLQSVKVRRILSGRQASIMETSTYSTGPFMTKISRLSAALLILISLWSEGQVPAQESLDALRARAEKGNPEVQMALGR